MDKKTEAMLLNLGFEDVASMDEGNDRVFMKKISIHGNLSANITFKQYKDFAGRFIGTVYADIEARSEHPNGKYTKEHFQIYTEEGIAEEDILEATQNTITSLGAIFNRFYSDAMIEKGRISQARETYDI